MRFETAVSFKPLSFLSVYGASMTDLQRLFPTLGSGRANEARGVDWRSGLTTAAKASANLHSLTATRCDPGLVCAVLRRYSMTYFSHRHESLQLQCSPATGRVVMEPMTPARLSKTSKRSRYFKLLKRWTHNDAKLLKLSAKVWASLLVSCTLQHPCCRWLGIIYSGPWLHGSSLQRIFLHF